MAGNAMRSVRSGTEFPESSKNFGTPTEEAESLALT
jgi:hypothetical protein